jgi:hypothetical protein
MKYISTKPYFPKSILILSSHLLQGLQVVSSLQAFQPEFCSYSWSASWFHPHRVTIVTENDLHIMKELGLQIT